MRMLRSRRSSSGTSASTHDEESAQKVLKVCWGGASHDSHMTWKGFIINYF